MASSRVSSMASSPRSSPASPTVSRRPSSPVSPTASRRSRLRPAVQQPGQPYGEPQVPPYAQQPGQQPYGQPGQYYGQAPAFTQPPKKGMPVWGWVAGGVGAVAVVAVAGVLAFNGLAGGNKQPEVLPSPNASESAAPEESADASATESASAVYLFDESDFTTPPAWMITEPSGWTKEEVKAGMFNYRNASLQCTFTTYQAVLSPTGETGDEATTALVMDSEIAAVEKSVGKPVEVVTDAASTYVNLRDGSQDIELQEAELRFKNDKDVDVVYRMAVRATSSSNGLMELALACPGSMITEPELWTELTDSVSMVDAP